jgi:hypothetical protein
MLEASRVQVGIDRCAGANAYVESKVHKAIALKQKTAGTMPAVAECSRDVRVFRG